MAIVDSEIKSIGEYLKNKQLDIPHYQRPYKWTNKNVIQLIDDIHRFKSDTPYRIGTVVIHQENGKDLIVDGQQRTITFLLILKAILAYKLEGLNDALKNQILEVNGQLFDPTFKSDLTKMNIQNNYNTIKRKLDSVDESFVDYFLNKCQVNCFKIDDVSEAFQFFDSQNARGKDLEPHDLLKAFHLREIHTKNNSVDEEEVKKLVATWENTDSKELAKLFAEFLFRVRGWSKGDSSRYFTKKDIDLFKGITLDSIDSYPYTLIFRNMEKYLKIKSIVSTDSCFPFQLDQAIVNGKYFFEMVSYYKSLYDNMYKHMGELNIIAKEIIDTLDKYEGRNRTGDKYVRMLFDCALLFYVDKFGMKDVSKAIEKIFIWAYRIRLTYQNLQLVSVDNYVVHEMNMFKKIKEATFPKDLGMLEIPLLTKSYESDKTTKIKDLYVKMNYYAE
ncbi:Protein of unknown function DUF262 [Bacteroides luti]|uniref:Uncharacterized protein n=1 Tax=Bacteroides luti TaxID=1297750 RepID=A0A1M5H3A6_9BACE|nr:DUF262 domain-containing protein [Bacteroides luti]SHG10222.1 Protein of unknown function DUF262 [Bacteroides luti]